MFEKLAAAAALQSSRLDDLESNVTKLTSFSTHFQDISHQQTPIYHSKQALLSSEWIHQSDETTLLGLLSEIMDALMDPYKNNTAFNN